MRRQRWLVLALSISLLIFAVPAALAVGWTNVGTAGTHFNEDTGKDQITANPVYSSQMRLYVGTHSPCGGNNFYMAYLYPDFTTYASSGFLEICTASETPANWGVAGGNKYAGCGEAANEPTDPAETCQRYSTT